MPREFDIRLQDHRQLRPEKVDEARAAAVAVSDELPGRHHLVLESMDSRSGNPALIRSVGAPPAGDNLAAAAVEHLDRIRQVLGLAAEPTAWFGGDGTTSTTSSGATAVHLQQTVADIPVFQAVRTVVFSPDRAVRTTAGVSFSPTPGLRTEPSVSPIEAVVAAARHLTAPEAAATGADVPTLDLATFSPATTTNGHSPGPMRRTMVTAPPFDGPVEVSLLWFDVDAELRLAWEVLLGLPDGADRYRVIVDARVGDVLYSRATTMHVVARANVALPDPGSPRLMREFPLPLGAYPVATPPGLPGTFPRDWVAVDRTDGINVRSLLPVPAEASGPAAVGAVVNGILTFDPADPAGDDQRRIAAFYLCNYMHNLLYLLGFREGDGNFDSSGGRKDPVVALIHPNPLPSGANINVGHTDGFYPTMNLDPYLMAGGRHTALEAGVVFHEYTHGLTTRLVGGYSGISTDKPTLANILSSSLGEGWSDYVACTLIDSTAIGTWVSGNAGGIRGFRYDEAFPDHYGMLGTGRYNEVHNNGEIWCAALMELNRRIGRPLTLQLVVDGLKLTPANPTYLEARNAILDALEDKRQAENWEPAYAERTNRQAWRAFARFGMGHQARAGSSLDYVGIRADFTVPPYPATLYAITENTLDPVTGRVTPLGDLLWYRHDGRSDGTRSWQNSNGRIGNGWAFSHVFGAGEGVIYAITERTVDPVTGRPKGGDLLWYRHDGWRAGKNQWTVAPAPVARRWTYRHVFSGGDGIIYAIRDNGDLLWQRHDGWLDGNKDRWTAPVDERVGNGWNFTEVFSGGSGIIYAVTERALDPVTGQIVGGDLVWYRHDGWRTGRNTWAPGGARVVRRHWDAVESFSGGDGVIYARRRNGDLMWFRHDGWHDGSNAWAPGSGQRVGNGWAFKQVFVS